MDRNSIESEFIDASREGNDCWVTDEWVFLKQWGVAVHKRSYSGMFNETTYRVHESPNMFDMPEEVQKWFD